MRVLLYRVDDRLIHGQVVLGWGRRLGPDRLIVVDDRIARDRWERELLAAAAPPEIPAMFITVREAALALPREAQGASFVLLESAGTALALADAGFLVPALNLGGIHRQGGRQVTPYLFLLPEDVAALRELAGRGVEIFAQDVPDSRRVDAVSFLDLS